MNELPRLVISIILAFGVAIVFKYLYLSFHEGGHYLAAKILGFKNVKVGYEKFKIPTYVEIKDEEIEMAKNTNVKILIITLSGIVFGLIPFLAIYIFIKNVVDTFIVVLFGVAVLLYFRGCKKDFKQIVESIRTIRED